MLQVFDLQDVKPHEFVLYGLGCLEKLASLGDQCAKEIREKVRVVVCSTSQSSQLIELCGCVYRCGLKLLH